MDRDAPVGSCIHKPHLPYQNRPARRLYTSETGIPGADLKAGNCVWGNAGRLAFLVAGEHYAGDWGSCCCPESVRGFTEPWEYQRIWD